jgi:hypothetical protein
MCGIYTRGAVMNGAARESGGCSVTASYIEIWIKLTDVRSAVLRCVKVSRDSGRIGTLAKIRSTSPPKDGPHATAATFRNVFREWHDLVPADFAGMTFLWSEHQTLAKRSHRFRLELEFRSTSGPQTFDWGCL